MKILNPNTGESTVHIPMNAIYVGVADYNSKFLLKKIKIREGHHTWFWIDLTPSKEADLTEFGEDKYFTFDNAINRAINNPYFTVYQFDNLDEMTKEWNNIVFKDSITTVYKSEKE